MQRYVLTGAPGSGKTTIAMSLRVRGWPVVPEAATDVITHRQMAGITEPWHNPGFIDSIVALQRARQLAATTDGALFFDRSPLCTLALARYLDLPVTDRLASEIRRIGEATVYERGVFLVRPLGFITPTAARKISYEESLRFEAVHERVYREHGFDLIDVPAGVGAARRAEIIEAQVADT